jgi:hypothetical protein
MKAASITATTGPPALTTVYASALPLIPELIFREQTGVKLLTDANPKKA